MMSRYIRTKRERKTFVHNLAYSLNAKELADELVHQVSESRLTAELVLSDDFLAAIQCFLFFDHKSFSTLRNNYLNKQVGM